MAGVRSTKSITTQKLPGYVPSTYDSVLFVSSLGALIFLAEFAYDKHQQSASAGKPIVYGIVKSSHRVTGKISRTNTIIEFNASAQSSYKCIVSASFDGVETGLQEGATIRVALSDDRCGTPWYPDHIEPPVIPLVLCSICLLVAGAMYLRKWIRRR